MLKYIIKRIAQAVPLLFLITLICFTLMHIAPYDVVDSITNSKMTRQEMEEKREEYGLNDPMHIQYIRWLKNICRGEFGNSLLSHTSIKYDLKIRIPATVRLVLPSYLSAYILAIILGLVAANNRNKWQDKLIDGLCSVGLAVPTFWVAMIMIYFLGYKLKIFPLLGMHTIGKEDSLADYLRHFFMPYVVLVIAFLPDLTRYVRASAISQLKEDYVLVQKAFGAGKQRYFLSMWLKMFFYP